MGKYHIKIIKRIISQFGSDFGINIFSKVEWEVEAKIYFTFGYNCKSTFLSTSEVIKLLKCDKLKVLFFL